VFQENIVPSGEYSASVFIVEVSRVGSSWSYRRQQGNRSWKTGLTYGSEPRISKGMKQWKQCTLEVVGEIIYSRTEGATSEKCMAGRVMYLHKAWKLD
jgi:hypothetical protein